MIKITIRSNITRSELAAVVTKAMREGDSEDGGDDPILVGGAVATIYTNGRFYTKDLDFITWKNTAKIRGVMHRLGFVEKDGHWKHQDTELLVQFVGSTLAVGSNYRVRPIRMKTRNGYFSTISPLDSACDRFSWFLNSGDSQSLDQAVDIIVTHKIPLIDVSVWLHDEGYLEKEKKSAMDDLAKLVQRKIAKRKRRGSKSAAR